MKFRVGNRFGQFSVLLAFSFYPIVSLQLLSALIETWAPLGTPSIDHVGSVQTTLILAICFVFLIISMTSHITRDALPLFNDSIAEDTSRHALYTVFSLLVVLLIAAPFNFLASRLYETKFTTLTCLNALPFIFNSLILRVGHLRQLTVLDWKDLFRPMTRSPVIVAMRLPKRVRQASITVQFGAASFSGGLCLCMAGPSLDLEAWKGTLLLSSAYLVVESAGDYYHYTIGRPGQWPRLQGQAHDDSDS